MFWRFGFHSTSTIDGLLEKEGLQLTELLDEEELLQECKSHNSKLIEYFCKADVISQLLHIIATAHDDELSDENKRFKYPYLACEVLCSEVYAISEAITNAPLAKFWQILDKPAPLNSLLACYFGKINSMLIEKKTSEMIEFIKQQPDVIPKILNHIGTSAVSDLLLKLISIDGLMPEAHGIIEWLDSSKLIPLLIDKMNPKYDPEMHNLAAQSILDIIAVSYQNMTHPDQILAAQQAQQAGGDPIMAFQQQQQQNPVFPGGNVLITRLKSGKIVEQLVNFMLEDNGANPTSTLVNGINIIIEIIRRYCSEIEQAEFQQHHYSIQLIKTGPPPPSPEKLKSLATELNDLLSVVGKRLNEFAELLRVPRNNKLVDTTLGKVVPLGSERLKTCELFAEMLHLQYLFTSSPLFERLVAIVHLPTNIEGGLEGLQLEDLDKDVVGEGKEQAALDNDKEKSIAEELASLTDYFVENKILPLCLDLFFEFPWNNFLHSVVYDMIAKVFNTYTFTTSVNLGTMTTEKPETTTTGTGSVISGDGILSRVEGSNSDNNLATIVENSMIRIKNSVRLLVISVFREGGLIKKITLAQRTNDYEVDQIKGVRLGYMGHLTYISDEVCKLIEKCNVDLGQELGELLQNEIWNEYVNGILLETKERDRQPLGGIRPHNTQQLHMPLGDADDGDINKQHQQQQSQQPSNNAISSTDTMSSRGVDSDEEEDEMDNPGGRGNDVYIGEGEVASDQFARYLCQQMVNDLPDRFLPMEGELGLEDSDEEEDEDSMNIENIPDRISDFMRSIVGENAPPSPSENSSGSPEVSIISGDGKEVVFEYGGKDIGVQGGFDMETPVASTLNNAKDEYFPPKKMTVDKVSPILLDYNLLISNYDYTKEIEIAFGNKAECLGVLLVKNVPNYIEMRETILELASKFANLDDKTKEKYINSASKYNFGWSHGKEIMNDPIFNSPPSTINKDSSYHYPNIWPTEELPELEPAFMQLGQLIVQVGRLVSKQCDRYIHKTKPELSSSFIETAIADSATIKARLLHYFPLSNGTETDEMGSWCGLHIDHSMLTGLTSAMYIDESETGIQELSKSSEKLGPLLKNTGLYIKNRSTSEFHKINIPNDCIAFQIGEAAQVASDNLFVATPHLVKGIHGCKDICRNTYAVFMQPNCNYILNEKTGLTFGQFTEEVLKRHYD